MARVPGDIEERQLARNAFNKEVERVARLMCEEMGLLPMEIVREPISNPHARSHFRWELMREQAANALAGWRAVQKYILTET